MSKFVIKIQSFSDVITNSSSSVFVMNAIDANHYGDLPHTEGGIDIERITMDWLYDRIYEFEMVCDMLKVDPATITCRHPKYGYWEEPDPEIWHAFLESHKEQIEETFRDLYWVEIEDHFEGVYEVTENAYDDAIWSDYRH
jgi:hypothetical protein